jgi:hypothetical protein
VEQQAIDGSVEARDVIEDAHGAILKVVELPDDNPFDLVAARAAVDDARIR